MAFGKGKPASKGGSGSGKAAKVPADAAKTATSGKGEVVHYYHGRKFEPKATKAPPPLSQTDSATPEQQGITPPTPEAKATGNATPPPDNAPPPPNAPEDAHAAMDENANAADSHQDEGPPKKGTAGKPPPFAKKGAAPPSKKGAPPVPPSKKKPFGK